MTNLYRKKAVFNWSGGKDSALALYKILQDKNYEITSLLTTVNKETQYSSMHRIPVSLLKAQAKSIGLPIYIVNLPPKGDINDYETNMAETVLYFKSLGVNYFVFGDMGTIFTKYYERFFILRVKNHYYYHRCRKIRERIYRPRNQHGFTQ